MIKLSLAKKLMEEFETLTESQKNEVIDFVDFLSQKNNKSMEELMDDVISENQEALRELAK